MRENNGYTPHAGAFQTFTTLDSVSVCSSAFRRVRPRLKAELQTDTLPNSGFSLVSELTRILSAIEQGDAKASAQLLPLVYEELRKLAAQKLAQEAPGQTLQATALVHEAYLRLVDADRIAKWDSRGHFFAAAAEAMRRILIDNARRKQAVKHGHGWRRQELLESELAIDSTGDDLIAVNEALMEMTSQLPDLARLVDLRFFAGLTLKESAQCLGISLRTAHRQWAYARAWLRRELDRAANGAE